LATGQLAKGRADQIENNSYQPLHGKG